MKEAPSGKDRIFIEKESEIQAIVDFLKSTWVGIENLKYSDPSENTGVEPIYRLVEMSLDMGVDDAAGWIDDFEVGYETSNDLGDKRGEFLKAIKGLEDVYDYDYLERFLGGFGRYVGEVCKRTKGYPYWDYSAMSGSALNKVQQVFDGIDDLKPKEYAKEEANYDDFDGMEYDSKAWCALFNGYDISAVRSYPLPDSLHWSHVMYSERCQGLSIPKTLVSTIYSHGLGLAENNNTVLIKQKLTEFAEGKIDQPFNRKALDISELKENPLLAIVFEVYEYEKSVMGKRFYDFMKEYTEEDVEKVKENIRKRRENPVDPEAQKKRAMEITKKLLEKLDREDKDESIKEAKLEVNKFVFEKFGMMLQEADTARGFRLRRSNR